nr:uncharacterized protein LOC123497122 isoform X2 [Aegilops tauschii subsp. strangulata]
MPPSLQGAGEIGAEDKKQRFGHGGLELLGRWRRPSWFVMEAAPPASWLRYVSAQRNEEWIHEAWRKRRCQPGHDARVCPSPLKPLELRDIDTGNKIVERFRTDEALETTNISSLLIRKDSRTKL